MSEEVPAKSSRTARIAQVVGLAAPALTVVGILLSQIGQPAMVGFRLFTLAILLGLVALVLGAISILLTRGDARGRRQALTGFGCGVLMLAVVVVAAGSGGSAPAINDITTDLDDPPSFQPRGERDMSFPPPLFADAYTPGEYRDLIRSAYPDLEPIRLNVAPAAAFAACVAQAEAMGWTIVRQDDAARRLEAEDETALFRFVDDVSIRVRSDGTGSVVDVRSKSRDGRGDVGANAARIRAFRTGLTGRVQAEG